MRHVQVRPKPMLLSEYCKGCGRCIEACNHGCLTSGTEIHPKSGYVPVALDLALCNGCGLCFDACPEPYGLVTPDISGQLERADAERARRPPPSAPRSSQEQAPSERIPLPAGPPLLTKGAHAAAIGALLAGCRHFFGYPITPSTEAAELMSKLLPAVGGTFLQAPSELAAANMMYGCGAAGVPALTFTSSPGFSLMLEAISYLIGSELPAVFVDVMRAGPGLGNVFPEQSDVKLACRGLGHGNTHALVLAPATPQEMLDMTFAAFELSLRYRNPVVILADAYLGQMTGRVALPSHAVRPALPAWGVFGDGAHRRNVVTSIFLGPQDEEAHNAKLIEKYARISAVEQRAAPFDCEDAEILLVACNTPAQLARGAVRTLRAEGVRAGLFRPQTLWPFPIDALLPLLSRVRRFVIVEASDGQLEDELRLALSHAVAGAGIEIDHLRYYGGILPSQQEIVEAVRVPAKRKEARA